MPALPRCGRMFGRRRGARGLSSISAHVTVWRNNKGRDINAARQMDMAELERVIRTGGVKRTKDELPLLKLASFGNVRTQKGSLRHDPNVLAVHGVEGDYDEERLPMESAAEMLAKHGVAAIFYESPSATKERHRWRVIVPMSIPMEGTTEQLKQQHAYWVGVLNALLGGVLSGESFTLSQSYYFGRVEGTPERELIRLDGKCLDELEEIPPPIIKETKVNGHAKPGEGHGANLEGIATGEHIYNTARNYAGRLIAKGLSAEESLDLLRGYLLGHKAAWQTDGEQQARWQEVWDKLPGMIQGAVGKDYAPAFCGDGASQQSEPWPTPADLWSAIAPTPALPRGLLPATLDAFAYGKPDTFCPAALGAAALATCSIAASDHVRLVINPTWRERFCVWIALHGPSSAAKSPTIAMALRPLIIEQSHAIEEFREALHRWKTAKKAAKESKAEFDDPEPVAVRYFTHSATIEALTELEQHTEHGVGLIHDELSALIAAMDGAYKEKSANERGHWLALYDGGMHLTDRILRGTTVVKNHSAAILGAITTDKLASLVNNTVADGLTSRMSLTGVPVLPPSDDLEAIPSEAYTAYERLVSRLVNCRPSATHEVTLPAEAREILGAAKRRWQAEGILYAERLPRYTERLGKLTGMAARVAVGFALIEAAESGPFASFDPPVRVSPEQMRRACEYVDYQARHDLAFYAAAAGQDISPAIAMTRRVGAWLLQLKRENFQLGDLTRGILEWRSLKSTDQLAALELLDHLGWIRPSHDAYFRGVQFVRGISSCSRPLPNSSGRRSGSGCWRA